MSNDAVGTQRSPRSLPGLDVAALETWLRDHADHILGEGPLEASLIAGGRSNLTYRIDGAAQPLVLRRPPLGHVQRTAHDMGREFRVISALHPTAVPVPRPVQFIDDPLAGVDLPFYLMQRVEGETLNSLDDNERFTPEQLRSLSIDLTRVLANLHVIDPAEVGLEQFGKPEGFLTRQLDRWGRQYDGSRSRDLPELDALQRELATAVPETRYTSIVHGDFRLDNALVAVDEHGAPRITAVLDWEMATLGDSLTDLGLFGLYWNINTFAGMPPGAVATSVAPGQGYPEFEELVAVYADAAGIEVPDMSWYLAFAAFKLAVILEGIHFRYQAGQTVGEGFETMGSIVLPLAAAGRRHLAGER